MKVVHLSTAKGWRGGEQQCLYLAKGLQAHGVESEVLAPPEAPLLTRAREAGVPTAPLNARGEFDLPAVWRLRRCLRETGADLIHAHDGHAVGVAALAGWLAGVPRVCTRRVDFALRGRWKYRRGMDRVIAISEAVAQVCRAGGVPPESLAVVHSGIDPERLQETTISLRRLREELGLSRRDAVLLNVAALTDHKGQCYLLEAMLLVTAACRHAHLLIAGAGELEESLRAQVRELALEERVHFLGYRNDIGALLRLCDVFVMASHLEGLCTSVLDAMALGRPVVVTDAGGLPEVVVDGESGCVVPARDPEALAAALIALLGDRPRREALARAGAARVRRGFTVEAMVAGTVAVYREVLGAGAAPSPGSAS